MEPVRFTLSTKVLLRNGNGEYLVLKRSDAAKNNPGRWDLPGGKQDPGEDFETGLLREVREETSVSIALERVIGASQSEMPARTVAYLVLEGRLLDGQVQLSEEHQDFRWLPAADLAKLDLVEQFRSVVSLLA